MNPHAILTEREQQVAELIAWGATKKEVASHLYISVRTVENHARNIYGKINCSSASELSAWWFCTHHNISLKLSPLARTIVTAAFIGTYFLGSFNPNADDFRMPNRAPRTARTLRTARRRQENINTYILSA